jgi:hypothetical protein
MERTLAIPLCYMPTAALCKAPAFGRGLICFRHGDDARSFTGCDAWEATGVLHHRMEQS